MKHSIETLIEHYNKGLSSRQIANLLGDISPTVVAHHLRKASKKGLLTLRSRSSAGISSSKRKYEVDDNFFEKIDDEYKAYTLGFLYADGYNNEQKGRIEINIVADDVQILEEMKAAMKLEQPLMDLKVYGKDKEGHPLRPKKRLNINSRKISQDLKRLGCYQGKSLTCKFPDETQVPTSLLSHFIRGYFDGDGCITYSKANNDAVIDIVGSEDFIAKLTDVLNDRFGFVKKPFRQGKVYRLSFNGINQVKLLYEFFYKDANIFLKRKYIRFGECFKFYEENTVHYPKVAKCDMDGNILCVYENTMDAFRDNPGTFSGNIWRVCKGIHKSHKGFIWKFV